MGELLRSEKVQWVWRGLNGVLFLCGLGAGALLVAEIGFSVTGSWVRAATAGLLLLFIGQELLRVGLVFSPWRYLRRRWLELALVCLAGVSLVLQEYIQRGMRVILPGMALEYVVLVYLAVTQSLVLGALLVRVVRYHAIIGRMEIHPGALLGGSFLLLSLLGVGLLLLPAATVDHINVVDALFTAVSAVCVTGLTVV
ncbi:MAG: hypothetical protein RMK93_08695, partial [Bacteroidota bacterium]|nr:hypothetical protein [Bacteroidota bacterium]